MRIVVFSDTHGRIEKCVRAIETLVEVDMIIHLGDNLRDVRDLGIIFSHIPCEFICGNNDFTSGEKYEKIVEVEGKKLFITHGHTYGVKQSLSSLANKVKDVGADMGLYGHTHQSFDGFYENAWLFNPGSISLPASGEPSCGVIEIEDGKMKSMIWSIK